MMAPKYMRASQIWAITVAARELDEPIDRIEIDGPLVRAFAGGASVAIRCHMTSETDADGNAMLGSGTWIAEAV